MARAPADVQAAIVVMGRRNTISDGNSGFPFDFSLLNLSHLNFDKLNFDYANFAGANVNSSTFKGTNLCGTNFRGAEMGSVEIVDSDARLAYLEAPSTSSAPTCAVRSSFGPIPFGTSTARLTPSASWQRMTWRRLMPGR
jgi:uncharacterized protein YjbI with pentapeptide repeats